MRARQDSHLLIGRGGGGGAPLPPVAGDAEETGAGISLTQVLLILRAHWRPSVIILVSILAVGSTIIKLLPKSYTATATLKVDGDLKDPLAGEQGAVDQRGSYIPTEMELMQSPEIMLAVVDQLGLAQIGEYSAGYSGDPANLRQWVQEKLAKNVEVERGTQGSLLIFVTATARDPILAANIANAIVDNYLKQERQRVDDPNAERARRYTEQLAELKAKVSAAEQQVANFRESTGVADLNGQKSGEAETLSTLEQRLEDAKNARRLAEVKASSDPLVAKETSAAHARVQELENQIATQQAKLAELRTTLGPRHPKVLEIESQMAATRESIATEMQTYARSANADLVAARELEQKMQQAVDQQRAKVIAAGKLREDGAKYVLELESAESVYKRALDGYDQIMFASAGHYTYVGLVSRAVPALKSTKPNKIKLLVFDVLAAIAFGLLGPLGYELVLNRRIRCRDDLERGFRVPVLVELDALFPDARTA